MIAALVGLAACRDEPRTTVDPAGTAEAAHAEPTQAPAPLDLGTLPKAPGPFGPWSTFPLGSDHATIEKARPALFDLTIERDPLGASKTSTYLVDAAGHKLADASAVPRFGGVFYGKLVAFTTVLDPKTAAQLTAAWGEPREIVDEFRGPNHHTLWVNEAAGLHIERTIGRDDTVTLTTTSFVPLARYLGAGGLQLDAKHSLIGMPYKQAIAQVEAWARDQHLAIEVEDAHAELVGAIHGVTGADLDASRVVVVNRDGSTKPLAELPTTSIDLHLPPTEDFFEQPEYQYTPLRLWVDEHGHVSHYWLSMFVSDRAAFDRILAQLARSFGKPKRKGGILEYRRSPRVCFPAEPRSYVALEVGVCK
jgi:hypothetical protein